MWAVVNASVIGTSHGSSGAPCQDTSSILRFRIGDEDVLVAAIADGAGSASHSQIGSSEAVQHLVKLVAQTDLVLTAVSIEQVRDWFGQVLAHLNTVAEREQIKITDLACILLLSIVWKGGAIFSQLGDGAWVVEKEGTIAPGTWPENGEYANVTVFITSPKALALTETGTLAHLQFNRVEGSIDAIAGFTDGIQSLVLKYADKTAHAPFFSKMFQSLRACTDETELITPLQQFLASDSVTTRTDDDKTLVLAVWREAEKVANADGIPN